MEVLAVPDFDALNLRTGAFEGVDIADYHRSIDAVSKSTLMQFEKGDPKHVKRYIDHGLKRTPSMVMGLAVDDKLFDPIRFAEKYIKKPTFSGDGSVVKRTAWEKEQKDAGRMILTPAPYQSVLDMAEAVKDCPHAWTSLTQSTTQLSLYWNDPDTGRLCKNRPDFYRQDRGITFDLKKSRGMLTDKEIDRDILEFGMDCQAAMARAGCLENGLPWNAHVLVFVSETQQIDGTYPVRVIELHPDYILLGEARYMRQIRQLVECEDSGEWPGAGDEIDTPAPSKWTYRIMEEEKHIEEAQRRLTAKGTAA